MSDNITIIMPNGIRYLRSEEHIWAVQAHEHGIEIIADPATIAENLEQHQFSTRAFIGNQGNLLQALIAELKLNAALHNTNNDLVRQLNIAHEENRSFAAYNRDVHL